MPIIRSAAAAAILALIGGCATADRSVPDGIDILTRVAWGAAAPVLPMTPHTPSAITIHHTATPQNASRSVADKLRALQRFSQERSPLSDGRIKEPWADVPYHFYIAVDGTVGKGRPIGFAGDSNTRYDTAGQIQIVVEGNFEEERPTPEQFESLWRLTWLLARQWDVEPHRIHGHRDHASTLCPGRVLYDWLPAIRSGLEKGR